MKIGVLHRFFLSYNPGMSSLEKPDTIDVRTLGSLAVGVAAGMVVADRLGRPAREIATVEEC